MMKRRYEYDLVLSFAGEDRQLVERLYRVLVREDIRVFYDRAEQASLWGKDLYQHLHQVYRDKGRFCAIFISKHYVKKRWAKHELKQAQARAFSANIEYILPIRLDDTKVPGLNLTTGYIEFRKNNVSAVAALLLDKLGRGKLSPEDQDRLGWDGKFVKYKGHRMVSYWPKQIKRAQKIKSLRRILDRVKYGDEADDWGANRGPCGDCAVIKGQFHVLGCDVEQCPSCGGQLISCDCNFVESF
jgi:hypothetical protein